MQPLRAVKGMNDILPEEMERWQRVERAFAHHLGLCGFGEVRTPYLEPTQLFVRAIGEVTDVVEKEMYSFRHHDEPLTLRPEGTAGAVRAYIEHAVSGKEPVTRWFYMGPMFRAERPQKGRYRQFYQLGAEILGDKGPFCDAELIATLVDFLRAIRVPDLTVLVNSLGGPDTRDRYRAALTQYLTPRSGELSEDSARRLAHNPLRILDSKHPKDQAVVSGAPTLVDCLSEDDLRHFELLKGSLDALAVPYKVEPRLVRGLDYYTRTLFEIKGAKERLGAGDTLVGGGRYDGLVRDLGGPDVPAIGFAAGLERLLIAMDDEPKGPKIEVFVAPLGDQATASAILLSRALREAGIRTETDTRGASLKSQLRRANTLGARVALVVGEDEVREGFVQVKDLAGHSQERVARSEVATYVAAHLAKGAVPA